MGTESEALRWKQWIDRWIKLSSPEVGSTINSSASSSKIDTTVASGHRKSLLTTEQLRYQLINMVKVPILILIFGVYFILSQEGDPIFCEGLCRELLNSVSHFRLAMKCLIGIETSDVSAKLILNIFIL